jgi:hypothetical protein
MMPMGRLVERDARRLMSQQEVGRIFVNEGVRGLPPFQTRSPAGSSWIKHAVVDAREVRPHAYDTKMRGARAGRSRTMTVSGSATWGCIRVSMKRRAVQTVVDTSRAVAFVGS